MTKNSKLLTPVDDPHAENRSNARPRVLRDVKLYGKLRFIVVCAWARKRKEDCGGRPSDVEVTGRLLSRLTERLTRPSGGCSVTSFGISQAPSLLSYLLLVRYSQRVTQNRFNKMLI